MGYSVNAIVTNTFWASINMLAMFGIIKAANWQPSDEIGAND